MRRGHASRSCTRNAPVQGTHTAVGTHGGCPPLRGYAPGTANRSRYGSATYGSKALAGTSATCTPSEYGPTWYGGNTKRSAVMRPAASSTGSNWLKLPASAPEPSSIILSPDLSISASRAGSISSASMRSEEHTSELQSLMRISYAVFCLKKKKKVTSV